MNIKILDYKHVLFDIEGTVAPIHFVHEVLFPYAFSNIESYLKQNGIPEHIVDSLLKENAFDVETNSYPLRIDHIDDYNRITHYLQHLIRIDRKSTSLKEIQGRVWEQGYTKGEIKSQIFSDAVKFFVYLKARSIKASIYSSGSILAQKLIFQYSDKGNLLGYFHSFFDTTTGPKKVSTSYEQIAQDLGLDPRSILFFTDVVEEAKAAQEINMPAVILKRPGNPPQPAHDLPEIEDFFVFL
jgi:enolase-phosphatase E1